MDIFLSIKDLVYTNLLKHEHLNKHKKPFQFYICYSLSSKKTLKGVKHQTIVKTSGEKKTFLKHRLDKLKFTITLSV